MLHAPSHVAAVRTLAARPYLPALHVPLQVEAVAPAAPQVPQPQKFCVALAEPALHQYPALHSPVQEEEVMAVEAP